MMMFCFKTSEAQVLRIPKDASLDDIYAFDTGQEI